MRTPADIDSVGPSRIKSKEESAGFDNEGPARVRARTGTRGQLPAKDYKSPWWAAFPLTSVNNADPDEAPLLTHSCRIPSAEL